MQYKALVQLAMNVRHLLTAFNVSQVELCSYAKLDQSTMTKFLQAKREVQLHHLDGMAERFGLEVYQLFQPGIARITDRRTIKDRRMGLDRRHTAPSRLAHIPTPHPPRRPPRKRLLEDQSDTENARNDQRRHKRLD